MVMEISAGQSKSLLWCSHAKLRTEVELYFEKPDRIQLTTSKSVKALMCGNKINAHKSDSPFSIQKTKLLLTLQPTLV